MAVRMPTSINQLFNDEYIAVQIIFLDVYTWNTGLIGDGSKFKGYFVIFLDIFFKNNVMEIVHKMSTLHIHIRGTDCLQSFSLWIL